MRLLAIDPGSTESAYVVVETDEGLVPKWFDKIPNKEMLQLRHLATAPHLAIEMIGHYGTGMPAGKDVFETCLWIGRFWETSQEAKYYNDIEECLVKRATIKTHICGSAKASDANVCQALRDRFGDKGTKKDPGFFYGFKADVWQCFALAVYVYDTKIKEAS